MFNQKYIFGIDSATISIPIQHVTYVESTGEQFDIREKNDYASKKFGVSTKYAIIKNRFVVGGGQIDVLEMTINAKQLGLPYIQGINTANFHLIKEYIHSHQFVYVTDEGWNSATLRDVDFKIDLILDSPEEVDKQILAIDYRTKKELKSQGKSVYEIFNSKRFENFGVEYYSRKNKRFKGAISPQYQNTRIYAKGRELLNHSSDFYYHYLKESDFPFDNILRIETWGGKNLKSLRQYGFESNNLNAVLAITMEQALPMFHLPFQSFLQSFKLPKIKSDELNINQLKDFYFMEQLLSLNPNLNLSEIIEIMLQSEIFQAVSKSQISQQKKKLFATYALGKKLSILTQDDNQINDDLNFIIGAA